MFLRWRVSLFSRMKASTLELFWKARFFGNVLICQCQISLLARWKCQLRSFYQVILSLRDWGRKGLTQNQNYFYKNILFHATKSKWRIGIDIEMVSPTGIFFYFNAQPIFTIAPKHLYKSPSIEVYGYCRLLLHWLRVPCWLYFAFPGWKIAGLAGDWTRKLRYLFSVRCRWPLSNPIRDYFVKRNNVACLESLVVGKCRFV